jgi:hypothetical protein
MNLDRVGCSNFDASVRPLKLARLEKLEALALGIEGKRALAWPSCRS